MNTAQRSLPLSEMAVNVFGFAGIVLILSVVSGFNLPFIHDIHSATIALGLIGLAMCVSAVLGNVRRGHNLDKPETWTEAALGLLMLPLLLASIFDVSLPLLNDHYTRFTVLAILIMAKTVIANLPTDDDPPAA
jgi:drug/metabolite transporter (DMT)-like permease